MLGNFVCLPRGKSPLQSPVSVESEELERCHEQADTMPPWHKKDFWKWCRHWNPYECLTNVSRKPFISRAYFKFIECAKHTQAFKPGAHFGLFLCESPGGFVQAALEYGLVREADVFTLRSDSTLHDSMIVHFENDPKVHFFYGPDGSGNILTQQLDVPADRKYLLITADGATSSESDPRHQEKNMMPLVEKEIEVALAKQETGGCLLLKMFEGRERKTMELLSLLNMVYEHVWIGKPMSSRICNGEFYVVCENFRGIGTGYGVNREFCEAAKKNLEEFATVRARYLDMAIHRRQSRDSYAKKQEMARNLASWLALPISTHRA